MAQVGRGRHDDGVDPGEVDLGDGDERGDVELGADDGRAEVEDEHVGSFKRGRLGMRAGVARGEVVVHHGTDEVLEEGDNGVGQEHGEEDLCGTYRDGLSSPEGGEVDLLYGAGLLLDDRVIQLGSANSVENTYKFHSTAKI